MPNLDLEKSRRIKVWVLVTWPAFLAACVMEALVFAAVDPAEVRWPVQTEPSHQAVYTAAFFSFWLIAMACSSLVLWLNKSPRDVNDTARG